MSVLWNRITRRAMLKGAGVAMCLPWLEALESAAAAASAGPQAAPPVRMGILYMPNGVNPHTWTPEGLDTGFELSPTLSALEGLKSEVLVLSQLMNKQSIDGDGHYAKVAPFLTGTHITKTTGADLRCGGVSMDQLAAQHVGNFTLLPSLELSIEPPTTYVDTNVGYTALYGSHISWSTPTTPVTREIDPQLAFNRVFRSGQTTATQGACPEDASILDAVAGEAQSLRSRIGVADRARLDEYFESVRSVERRIAFDAALRHEHYRLDPKAQAEIEGLGRRIDAYYHDPALIRQRGIDHTGQVRLMLDIMVLAFWTDSTRVATFMFGNEVSGRNFSFLPGVNGSHHEISHHSNDKTKLHEYETINQWHLQQYAYMLQKMKSIREGSGTLLDNSMVLFGAGMRDGNEHSPYNLPIILAGRAAGSLKPGRHLVYQPKTQLCDLYRSMLSRVGVPIHAFGDSGCELPGLEDTAYRSHAPA